MNVVSVDRLLTVLAELLSTDEKKVRIKIIGKQKKGTLAHSWENEGSTQVGPLNKGPTRF